MEIIELNHQTASLLSNVARGVFDHAIDPANLAAFLDCPRHTMALAVDGDQVIGMASAVVYFHPDKSPQLWLNEIGVTPSRRGEGIGRRLVNATFEYGRKLGCANAWLGTETDNMAAQRCFESVDDGLPPQKFLLYEWQLSIDDMSQPSSARNDP